MPVISMDTGILLSAISVIVTIFLFIFTNQSKKSERAIIYGETIKNNEKDIDHLMKSTEEILKKIIINDADIMVIKRDIEYLKEQDRIERQNVEKINNNLARINEKYRDGRVNLQ